VRKYLNLPPDRTEWDVERYADHVKNSRVTEDGGLSAHDVKLQKFFKQSSFGNIDVPAVICDMHGKIVTWCLPDIICLARIVCQCQPREIYSLNNNIQENFHSATKQINLILYQSRSTSTCWRQAGFRHDQLDPEFQPGTATFSPGYFMQAHEVKHPSYEMQSYLISAPRDWLMIFTCLQTCTQRKLRAFCPPFPMQRSFWT
jgi:hypothetical protein